jgi:hypothetical protein
MASRSNFPQEAEPEDRHKSRRWPIAKHRKPHTQGGFSSDTQSLVPLKKKIRDLERLLKKMTDMPADLRIRKERELQATQFELERATEDQKRVKLERRYQMVRFFGMCIYYGLSTLHEDADALIYIRQEESNTSFKKGQ